MSDLLRRIQDLVSIGDVKISEHGYDELAVDDIHVREIAGGMGSALPIEEYLAFPKGPCLRVLKRYHGGNPIHAVWGIPRGFDSPAVLITCYRPDPRRWSADYTRRNT